MNPLAPAEAGQALRALPLKGEKYTGCNYDSNKYLRIISPLGEMSRSDRGVLSVNEIPLGEMSRSDRGVLSVNEIPLGEMSRSDRGVLSVEEIPRRELRSDRGVFTKKKDVRRTSFSILNKILLIELISLI